MPINCPIQAAHDICINVRYAKLTMQKLQLKCRNCMLTGITVAKSKAVMNKYNKGRETNSQSLKEVGKKASRQTSSQTSRQTEKKIDKTVIQPDRQGRQTSRQTDKQIDKQADIQYSSSAVHTKATRKRIECG
ncbi:hypothetical protein HELRODRAFT_168198 [Helobdella robusta]|uniref:Uncharacterized protein n=1 Tax=Helobdella robusta TaxID=6412 RepID=T1F0A7_HELRO|nr:hypothetical protein HELRODRAFT_168198 [Helobdella robusta]ESO09236.1 hypothetical protein HELRODRAFT_168198 [Helobdella robusta]